MGKCVEEDELLHLVERLVGYLNASLKKTLQAIV